MGPLSYNIASWNCATGLLDMNGSPTDKMMDVHSYIEEHELHLMAISECDFFSITSKTNQKKYTKQSIEDAIHLNGYDAIFPKQWDKYGHARIIVMVKADLSVKVLECPNVEDLPVIVVEVGTMREPKIRKRSNKFNLCDSVENSFCDKLSLQAQRNMKDLKELEVFQLLENAANDASFCSNSSQIKNLVSNAILPTPNKMVPTLKMMNNSSMLPTPISLSTAKTSFASSTPATHQSQVSPGLPVNYGNPDSSSQKGNFVKFIQNSV